MQYPPGWSDLSIHYDDLILVVAETLNESVDTSEGIEPLLPVMALAGRIVANALGRMLQNVNPEDYGGILAYLEAQSNNPLGHAQSGLDFAFAEPGDD